MDKDMRSNDRSDVDIESIARVGGWTADPRTDFLAWTKGVYDIFEVPPDQPPGFSEWMNIFFPGQESMMTGRFADCLSTGAPFAIEARAVTRTGRSIWVEIRAQVQSTPRADYSIKGTVQDITDRMKTDQALRESEAKFRTLADYFPVGIIIHRDGKLKYYGREAARLLGYEPTENLIGRPILDFVAEHDRKRLAEMGRRRYAGEDVDTCYEATLLKNDGTPIDVLLFSMLIDYEGETSILAAFADISDRKRFERELQESEERLLIAKNAAGLGIYDYNMATGEIRWDKRIRELWGVGPNDPITFNLFMEGVHPDDRTWVKSAMDRALSTGGGEYKVDFRIAGRAGGSVRWVSATAAVLFDKGELSRIVGAVQDITDRKTTEEELRRHRERLTEMVRKRTEELEVKTQNLEELNAALNVLLSRRELDKTEAEERFVMNIKNLILPYVEKIKKTRLDERQLTYLTIIEAHLNEVLSPLLKNMRSFGLTPTELQIASLVGDGKTTKEIAEILTIAEGTIEFHRKKIRKKLGLAGKTANLQQHLRSLK